MKASNTLERENDPQTIDDFTGQWKIFPDNGGYFVSNKLFEDSLAGILPLSYFQGKRVGDLGSGTGRIVRWLFEAGAAHVYAIEPAQSHETLKENTKAHSANITYINEPGDQIDLTDEMDAMVSLGVISYIPDLGPVFRATYKALKPGGKFFILAMSYEGNEFYCTFALPLRAITTVLPDFALHILSQILAIPSSIYGLVCKLIPIPMHVYFKSVFNKMAWHDRVMLIFDQLNPSYAKYYKKEELIQAFKKAGFSNIQAVHRYGYSWAICGEKS
jgi:2-polyprenyl-3-methyl-5-hydroxy-6-metoxy-1,4-benzoquinol methylase